MPADTTIQSEMLATVSQSVREALDPPLLLGHDDAARLLGVSRSAWYRLAGSVGFPAAVAVPGSAPRWRRADLERWVERLGARRGGRRGASR